MKVEGELYSLKLMVRVKRTRRERVTVLAICFGQSKYDFTILICHTRSNFDDTTLMLKYLPYFDFLFAFAVMVIAGRQ